MDAFSLSIFLGTILSKKSAIILIILIGIFHFFMPILGAVFGYKISGLINLNGDLIFGVILLLLSGQIFLNLYKEEEFNKEFNLYELLLLAFGVAIDSFSVGFGLSFSDNFVFYSSLIFSFCSMIFTYIGLLIGKYTSDVLGVYSKIIGGIVLLSFAIVHIF